MGGTTSYWDLSGREETRKVRGTRDEVRGGEGVVLTCEPPLKGEHTKMTKYE